MRSPKRWSPGTVGVAIPALLVLAAAAFSAAPAHANAVGFHLGANIANLGDDAEAFGASIAAGMEQEIGGTWTSSKDSRTGLVFGGSFTQTVDPAFALQYEVEYVQRGTKYTFTSFGAYSGLSVKETVRLNYIDFAILGRFDLGHEEGVRPFLAFGPVLGLKAGSSIKAEALGTSSSADISEGVKDVHFGGVAGAGLALRVGRTSSFVVQGRYFLGLTNLLDDSSLSLKASDLSLRAGVQMALRD